MASLAESNMYLKNREARCRMVAENTFGSSVFEDASTSSLAAREYQDSGNRRSKASAKKQDKAL